MALASSRRRWFWCTDVRPAFVEAVLREGRVCPYADEVEKRKFIGSLRSMAFANASTLNVAWETKLQPSTRSPWMRSPFNPLDFISSHRVI